MNHNSESLIESVEEAPKSSKDRFFFSLLERAGIEGKYQTTLVVIMSFIGYLCGGLMLITSYLFYQDGYVCPAEFRGSKCFDYVCSLPAEERLPFVPEPTINTLGNKFGDYRCSS